MATGIIIGLIVIAVFALTFYKKRHLSEQAYYPSIVPSTVDKTIPDSAVGFGYKCMWFAVKTDNKNRLAEILKLKNISDCNWQVGIDKAYNGSVFITPTIDGWTLACGWGLPHGDTKEGIEKVKSILQTLSKEFENAQFFSTHRVSEYHCWIKATNGQIERVYSYLGESGENITIEGQPTEFEKNLKLANTFSDEAKDEKYFEREDLVWADEELLMQVAEHWSIDPTKLDERQDIPRSLGLLGQR
ncbi:hypothetical protein [Rhizosphaericola mali]|uniref:Uncharacterized protein n=1 Tax=Rhizosphaericola mali TaxID=2545455 RepID=A0A5P2G2M0_9BACT|nr:hypothetical protein [Rhizosphaericola mali]QES87343.1 hypothetical protein E0W69_001265 [Rhizosphaericola mali]